MHVLQAVQWAWKRVSKQPSSSSSNQPSAPLSTSNVMRLNALASIPEEGGADFQDGHGGGTSVEDRLNTASRMLETWPQQSAPGSLCQRSDPTDFSRPSEGGAGSPVESREHTGAGSGSRAEVPPLDASILLKGCYAWPLASQDV